KSPKRSPGHRPPAYLVRDNDRAYGHVFTAMGIRNRPISPGSPWQNGIAERLIGTLRRECLDRLVEQVAPASASHSMRTRMGLKKLHSAVKPSRIAEHLRTKP